MQTSNPTSKQDTAPLIATRQPIFGRGRSLVGYDLLFRTEPTPDAMAAALAQLTDGKRAYLSFTERLLVSGAADSLPRDQVVIKIADTVAPNRRVLDACLNLRKRGYILALSRLNLRSPFAAYMDLAAVVTMDFQTMNREERARTARATASPRRAVLAERLWDAREVEEAENLGCVLLQGDFYTRPNATSGRTLSASEMHCLQAFQEVTKPCLDFDRLAAIIKRDVSFSYRLLRFVNSAALGLRTGVQSIRQALVLLGQKETTRWLSLVALRDLGRGRPDALMMTCVIRGRLTETLAPAARLESRSSELFLLGLFSAIEALLSRPAAEAVTELPLSPDVQRAILGEPSPLRPVLDVALAYEGGNWDRLSALCRHTGIPVDRVAALYLEAVAWANLFLQSATEAAQRPPAGART